MPTCSMPPEDILLFGRKRKQGESVWAPMIEKPDSSAENFPPTTKAMTSALPLVTKYLPPLLSDHFALSWSSLKPAAFRSFVHALTQWYGEPVSLTKSMKSCASSKGCRYLGAFPS